MFQRAVTFLLKLWRAAPVATSVLALALAASLIFGLRAAIFWHKHPGWDARVESVEPWMTPRFIARAWDVPPRDLLTAIDAPMPPPNGPMNLKELADFRGVPLEQIIAEVEAAIRTAHPDKGQDP